MNLSPNNQTPLFPKDFRILEFKDHEEELLTYFSNHEVSEIGFKEIFVLRQCRGAKNLGKTINEWGHLGRIAKSLKDEGNILYYGLSLEEAKNVAEHHREMGTYFRIVPTPCLTLECRKYKLSFFDYPYSQFDNEKIKKLIDSNNLPENRTYTRVITYLNNITNNGSAVSICFLISPDIKLNSCSYDNDWIKQISQFHYVSKVPNSNYKIEWEYTNTLGEVFQPDDSNQ